MASFELSLGATENVRNNKSVIVQHQNPNKSVIDASMERFILPPLLHPLQSV